MRIAGVASAFPPQYYPQPVIAAALQSHWSEAMDRPEYLSRFMARVGVEGLGPLTGEASGLLNTAIVGGAIIPWLQGNIADRIGIHHAFFLPAICYLYIVVFALVGKPRTHAA